MAIVQGEDGYVTFTIPVNPNEPDVYIPSFEEYVSLLNDEELATSLINRHGLITTPEVHGSFIQTMPNKFGIILGPEFSPLIYRGQNNDYDFMPSYYRYELADGNERIRHSIDWIKRNEFLQLITNTPYVTRTQNFKVLNNNYHVDLEAVSKLYNCVSSYLDVTRNLMIAYFFAYTYLDKEKNQLLPIEDFEKYSPMLYVGNIKTLSQEMPDAVKNMGLQPFLRAKVQQTMSINVLNDFTKIKSFFKKIELPKNPVVAKNIFNQFEGGKILFPGDYASRFTTETVVSDISDSH